MRGSRLRWLATSLVLAGLSAAVSSSCSPTELDGVDASTGDGAVDAVGIDADADAGGGADADAAETSVSGMLTLVAGTLGGPGELDGIGDSARLSAGGAWLNGAGTTLYVSSNGAVRRVELATGAVTTFAGTPIPPNRQYAALAKDGPPGSGIAYTDIGQLTSGPGATLFAGDGFTVRKVDLDSGLLSTSLDASAFALQYYADYVAPPPDGSDVEVGPVDAGFFQGRPESLAFDEVANVLWVRSRCVIRAFDLSNLSKPTLWGDPRACQSTDGSIFVARFGASNVGGIAVDSTTHRLFMLENDTVRVLDPGTANVASVALSRQSMTWLSFSKTTGKLYGAVQPGAPAGVQVAEIDPTTGVVKVIAGGAPVELDGVGDAAGFSSLFGGFHSAATTKLAINDHHTIREVELTGKVTTLAGAFFPAPGSVDGIGPAARFNNPTGVAADPSTAWVSDRANLTLRKVVLSTGAVTTVAGYAGAHGSADGPYLTSQFRDPCGVALDVVGDRVFVADRANHAIRSFLRTTGVLSTFVGDPLVSAIIDGPKVAAKLATPTDVAFDAASGMLYFTDDQCSIRRLDTKTTEVKTLVQGCAVDMVDGPPGVARFIAPRGLAFDPGTASVYVLDKVNDASTDARRVIRRVVASSGVTSTFVSGPSLVDPFAIIADTSNGSLIVGDYSTVLRVAVPSGVVTTIFGSPTQWGVRTGPLSQASLLLVGGLALAGPNDLLLTSPAIGALLRASGW